MESYLCTKDKNGSYILTVPDV